MAKKKYKYAFARQKHSQKGVISTVFAGVSLGLFGIAAYAPWFFMVREACIWEPWGWQHGTFCVWICTGASQLFPEKQKSVIL